VLVLGDMRFGNGTADGAQDAEASSTGLRETTFSRDLLLVSTRLKGLVSTDVALRGPMDCLATVARALISLC